MRGRRLFVLLVVLATLLMLLLPVPFAARLKAAVADAFALFYQAARTGTLKTAHLAGYLADGRRALEERDGLRARVAELEFKLQALRFVEAQNAVLREQVGFAVRQEHRLVLCEVVGRGDTSGWWQTVTINRGADAGIRPGLPVVATGGLVGRTVAVSRRTCDVLLVFDPTLKVSCLLPRTQAFGLLQGGGVGLKGPHPLSMLSAPDPFRLDYLSKDAVIEEGDDVVTSGLGGVFPEGIAVGKVSSVVLDSSGLYQRAAVTPTADLARLRYVFVLLD